jgi:hypothetical protein
LEAIGRHPRCTPVAQKDRYFLYWVGHEPFSAHSDSYDSILNTSTVTKSWRKIQFFKISIKVSSLLVCCTKKINVVMTISEVPSRSIHSNFCNVLIMNLKGIGHFQPLYYQLTMHQCIFCIGWYFSRRMKRNLF